MTTTIKLVLSLNDPRNPGHVYLLPDDDQGNRRIALQQAVHLVAPSRNVHAGTWAVGIAEVLLGFLNPGAATPAGREAGPPEPGPLTNVAERHQLAGLLSELDQLDTVLNTPLDALPRGDVEFLRTHPLRVELEHDYTPPTTSEVVRAVTVWLNARLAGIPPITRTTT